MSAFLQSLSRHRIKLLGLLVMCILAVIVTCNLRQPQHDPRVDALRKAGYPVTLAELDQWYPHIPDAQNAALIYTNAFASMLYTSSDDSSRKNIGDIKLPSRNETLSAADKAELIEMIASNAVAFRLLYSAEELTNSRYPIDFSMGFAMLLPHLAKVKGAASLLRYKSALHVANGEREEAVRALQAAIFAGKSLEAEPLLISQLVRYSTFGLVIKQLEYIENTLPLTETELARLQGSLSNAERSSTVERALAGELACDLAVFDSRQRAQILANMNASGTSAAPAIKEQAIAFALRVTGIFTKDRAYLMDALMTNMAVAKLDYPTRFQQAQKTSAAYGATPNRLFIYSKMLLPALGKFHTRDAEHVTLLRVAQTALAIERYRLAHNSALPSSLDELLPTYLKSVPVDPCDGQPLRYKKLDKGFVVYGVGSDGSDDGGAERKAGSTGRYDITFTIER
jgi:hypothetical protein